MSKPLVSDIFLNTGRKRRTGIVTVVPGPANNDWNPFAGDADAGIVAAAPAGSVAFVTGIDSSAAVVGDEVTIINTSAATILTFFDADTDSLAANRLALPNHLPLLLYPQQTVTFLCSTNLGVKFWRVSGGHPGSEFAPMGYPTPPTADRFFAQTAITSTWLAPCDDKSLAVRDKVLNVNYGEAATPQYDWIEAGAYRGVFCDGAADGWAGGDVNNIGNSSAIGGVWLAADADAATRSFFGRFGAGPSRLWLMEIIGGSGAYQVELTGAGGSAAANIVQNFADGVLRLFTWQLDRTAGDLVIRVAQRGGAVATATVDASGVGDLSGGAAPFAFLGALTGVQDANLMFFGGAFLHIGGAEVEGVGILPTISHRLGGE